MALLHYLSVNGGAYDVSLCALNCDHGIRGEESKRDSEFVSAYCAQHAVPLIFYRYVGEALHSEEAARVWRLKCFSDGAQSRFLSDGKLWHGYDFLATAHHANDNAETVLFNLARGSGVGGVCGMEKSKRFPAARQFEGKAHYIDGEKRDFITLIRPLLDCTRAEIDEYIAENAIPYVTDSTNLTDDYTRNKFRHNILPVLEECVPGAVKAIGRFSRLAREDEAYFSRQTDKIIKKFDAGFLLLTCEEGVIFKRAVVRVLREEGIKDYTSLHLDSLFALQSANVGKRYEFLGMVALKERDCIFLCRGDKESESAESAEIVPFGAFLAGRREFGGRSLYVLARTEAESAAQDKTSKVLRFDRSKIPSDASVRYWKTGDKFRKFGGGTKNLSDYFTDGKIPLRLRGRIPLIAKGSTVYVVCGVEISEDVKITPQTVAADELVLIYPESGEE